MFESSAQIAKASVLTVILVVFSTNTCAEIYKWRDARGVTKYSDIPPQFAFTKATRNEIINALQAKDICVLPNTKTAKTIGAVPAKLASKTVASNSTQMNFAFNNGGLTASSDTFRGNSVNSLPFNSPLNLAQNNPSASSAGKFTGRSFLPARKLNTLAALPSAPVAVKPAPVAAAPATVNTPPKQILAQATPPTAANTPNTTPSDSVLPPNIVQVALMPAVDISKNVSPATGYSSLQINPTSELPLTGQSGAVRVPCTVSHMSNDDPIVYPNQSGAAHHHTFFGNTSTNAKSDLSNMANVGNSTCLGGIMNRSAYWMPSMINTVTHTPTAPTTAIFYYKTGYTVPAQYITAPPKGLRMIAGNSKGSSVANAGGLFTCIDSGGNSLPWSTSIPNCAVGTYLQMNIGFPQCWDGVNLDSPDHKSHMAYPDGRLPTANKCPATHPIAIPNISVNFNFTITRVDQTKTWRLASDNYSDTLPGGFSSHADWVNGWNEQVMASIVKNCLQKQLDGHAHLLCDGRTFY